MSYRLFDANTALVVRPTTSILPPAPGTFQITAGVPAGPYVVELTSNGCVQTFPFTLSQSPEVDITYDQTDICNGKLTAVTTPNVSVNWTTVPTNGILSGAGLPTVDINPGQWLMRVQTVGALPAGFCHARDSTTVLVDNNISPAFSQSDACQDQVTLSATSPSSGAYSYRWYRNNVFINSGRQIFATATDDNQSYLLRVISALNGCIKDTPAQDVQVDGVLTVNLASTPPCVGAPFTLTATPSRAATFGWTADGVALTGQTQATLQQDRAGTYAVTATAATCTATATLPIILNPRTAGQLRELARICPDPANPDPNTRFALLDPGEDADFLSYDWFKDGVSLSKPDPFIEADEPGLYSVNLINVFGCASSDRTEVIVECDPVIVGPNAFRPTSAVSQGGDMVNQSFKLFTFFIDDEDFQVFIFNRWGEMIFQSPERDFRWNGGYNNNVGQIVPAGTYSYVVRYKSSYRPQEGIKEKRGGVVLLR
jgi:gliding motility-associated-like protein